ncbi:serine/threonine-protein kinase Sgk2-like [Sycon ciliatum]|uniref:serine/threonine-protein kinase Sgk2-like n=1 Tax=Sycon ciliatum TaxID=27933 RepID=UPI0020AD2E97|eukprot:scpid45903/ scgid24171/ Serine/threonine-protein kinase Sgk3; Cytokine-independent survival kinase; Serum/glucocorticoid-regulated kinase 3; Serum/glucocorticoid-regulated kinase-like
MAEASGAVISSAVQAMKIDGFETWVEGKRFTVYKVVVSIPNRKWLVFRRYNEFYTLHGELKKSHPDQISKLPGKRIFGNNFDPRFISHRMSRLDEFLQSMFQNKSLMEDVRVRDFLALENQRNAVPIHDNIPIDREDRGEGSTPLREEDKIDLGSSDVTINDFKLLKVIGKGSFGKVLLAEHKATDKHYAIKVLRKDSILKRNESRHIMAERNVLLKNAKHPFLVGLHYSFQTSDRLYFVLDYVNGGELFYHLQREKCFSEARAQFYAAEITSSLGYLHSMGIIYRDLKPENILLDDQGHIMLTDFGLCKEGIMDGGTTATFCGTPEYLAPEVLRKSKYSKSVDWWCLGCVLHEMIYGLPPFYSRNVAEMYDGILHKPLKLRQAGMGNEGRLILDQLLQKDPKKRLGSNHDANDIMTHNFFHNISWVDLYDRKILPPWNPRVSGTDDTSHVDPEFTSEPLTASLSEGVPVDEVPADDAFVGFTYNKDPGEFLASSS